MMLMFLGIYRLISFSSDKVLSYLDDDQCKHLIEFYKGDQTFDVMRRKYVYLYEHMNHWEKFERA